MGGPSLIDEFEQSYFQGPCENFPFKTIWDTYRDWVADKNTARRHWPWVALSANEYKKCREKRNYYDEPKPSEIVTLLNRIGANADHLANDLDHLHRLSGRLDDPGAPFRRGHLNWINEFLKQNLAGALGSNPPSPRINTDNSDKSPDVINDPDVQQWSSRAFGEFLGRLTVLSDAVRRVRSKVDAELLRRPRPQKDPDLYYLVWGAALVWESMTGRKASVNKVVSEQKDSLPDFVIFVTNVAKLAANHEPSYDEIATSFRNWKSAEKKSQSPV